MKKPLIFENRVDANDLRNIHNPGKYDHTLGEYAQVKTGTSSLVQIDPVHPTGLEPPPPDYQYDVPHQMKKPLIFENRYDVNDLRNIHNPDKYDHTLGEYVQTDDEVNKQPTAEDTKKNQEDEQRDKEESLKDKEESRLDHEEAMKDKVEENKEQMEYKKKEEELKAKGLPG